MDGTSAGRPFYVCCPRVACPGYNPHHSYAHEETALQEWNRRVQSPPDQCDPICHLAGFTTKDLIRGEMVCFNLDRTGALVSDKMQFHPHSVPLMKKPLLGLPAVG